MSERKPWSAEDCNLLRRMYSDTPTKDLAVLLGRSITTVYQAAGKMGLRKSETYLASPDACRLRRGDKVGASCRFLLGHVPANKGLRKPGWAPGRMAQTQFKKGGMNYNNMPIGATRWIGSSTGSRSRYLYRKVSDVRYVLYTVNWKAVHILYWEKFRGPVPPGHAVVFKDGDPTHIRMPNLECLSRADLMRRNTIHRLPEALKEVIRLKGAIKRVITCKRRKYAKEQNV